MEQRITFLWLPEYTAWHTINTLLGAAQACGKELPVAHHLIATTFTLSFPQLSIRNDSYSTADFQSGSQGDFRVKDTVFHVTVAPTSGHYEKCRRNLEDGCDVVLIVPDRMLMGARQNAENIAPGRISVASIESFVSQNLNELATYSRDELKQEFRRLFDTYNRRVDAIETDKSLLIEIPPNL